MDEKHGELTGTLAYRYLDSTKISTGILDNINLVVHSFEMALGNINEFQISESIKKSYLTKFYLLYHAKVLWPLRRPIVENKDKLTSSLIIENGNRQVLSGHDDSKLIIPTYARISISCLDYLIARRLIENSEWKNEVRRQFENLLIETDQTAINKSIVASETDAAHP